MASWPHTLVSLRPVLSAAGDAALLAGGRASRPACRGALQSRRWASPHPPGDLAVVREVRPSHGHGEHGVAWVKAAMADYYKPRRDLQYRSTNAMTLRQIDDKYSFLKPDTVVLDLGCFPGGWSQVAIERTHPSSSSSRVIGIDTVRMEALPDHTFIQGDIGKESMVEDIVLALGDRRADVVLADVVPPTIGLKMEDHFASMQACLFAGRIMERSLQLGGWFVLRLQWGSEVSKLRLYLDSRFEQVRTTKPPASRFVHREMFMVCKGFVGRKPIATEVQNPRPSSYKHEGDDRWDTDMKRRQRRVGES